MNTESKLKLCKRTCILLSLLLGICSASLIKCNLTVKDQQKTIDEQRALIAAGTQKSKTQDAQYSLLKEKYSLIIKPVNYTPDDITFYNIPLSRDLQQYTYEECIKYGIVDDYTLILAMMWHESNFNPSEISKTEDYGIMQINISNHKWLSQSLGITNFLDAKQNIDAGTYIISSLLRMYSEKSEALMVYNMGSSYAKQCWSANIHTTEYTRDILEKQQYLCSNKTSKK